MIVHSVEASPRVGRAFDRPPFELLSSVRRCMALLWCCAGCQLRDGQLELTYPLRACTISWPCPYPAWLLCRVPCSLYVSQWTKSVHRSAYTQQHIPLWRAPCWPPVDPI